MKRSKFVYIVLIVIISGLILKLVLSAIINPWIADKIEIALNKNDNYIFKIEKAQIRLLSSGIEIKNVSIVPKNKSDYKHDINCKIASVKVKGFNLFSALFSKKITIKSIFVSNCSLNGLIPPIKDNAQPIIIPLEIKVDIITFDGTNVSIAGFSNSEAYSIEEGILKVYDLHLIKNDTLSKQVIARLDFKAQELASVTADSMYSLRLCNIDYRSNSNLASADSFFIHPNYHDYNFTSRYKYQKDRIEAVISDINIKDFDAADYIRSGRLSCTYAVAGKMDLNIFRDRRKEFNHIERPVFQEIIYNYASLIRLDTINILNGNIIYREHAEKASESGQITFNNISAEIYNISNDPVFRNRKSFLELRCNALLMGKGKLSILLRSKIFDDMNSFSASGRLSEMEISEMNPYLENIALFYATSGKIDAIDFSFTANDYESNGKMTMLYNGLNITVKNKKTDDTTAILERIISNIANRKIMDSNPLKGEEARIGIINFRRDPEKFLFSYFAKSFLSGMKSSLLKPSKSR